MKMCCVVLLVVLAGCGGGRNTKPDAGCAPGSLDACEYPAGAVEVTKQTIMVTEPVTGRALPVLVRKPAGTGPGPVVVWSHGGGLNDDGHLLSPEWGDTLAAHGFVVLSIGHAEVKTMTAQQALCAEGVVPTAECAAPADEDSGFIALVKARDVIAVLEALPTLQLAGAELDLGRVAVMGWSAGARGPLVTHGTRFLPTASAPIYAAPHARPVAVVALSPMGPGYGGFYDGPSGSSWDQVRGPVFVATGDNDTKASKPDLTGATRRIAWERQPADGKRWLLYSKLPDGTGGHGTYNLGDLRSSDARVVRFSRALRSAVLAFLDAELRGDARARAWLDSGDARTLAGDADWAQK
jgi:dienelactone hydrolase